MPRAVAGQVTLPFVPMYLVLSWAGVPEGASCTRSHGFALHATPYRLSGEGPLYPCLLLSASERGPNTGRAAVSCGSRAFAGIATWRGGVPPTLAVEGAGAQQPIMADTHVRARCRCRAVGLRALGDCALFSRQAAHAPCGLYAPCRLLPTSPPSLCANTALATPTPSTPACSTSTARALPSPVFADALRRLPAPPLCTNPTHRLTRGQPGGMHRRLRRRCGPMSKSFHGTEGVPGPALVLNTPGVLSSAQRSQRTISLGTPSVPRCS